MNAAGPWVDEDRSKLDPLPPVDEFDDRPATKDIIQKHASLIQEVRENLRKDPLYDPIKHDDLWIVRFILSQRTVHKATSAAKSFLLYRRDRQLDTMDIRHAPPGHKYAGNVKGVTQYFQGIRPGAMTFSLIDDVRNTQRGILLCVHPGGVDQNHIATIEDDDWPFWYFIEWMFQVLDSVTRRTGRLTKGVRFIDMKGYSMRQNNRQFFAKNSKFANESQDHYPQMLATIYVLNTPTWVNIIYQITKRILPQREVEKFAFIQPTKSRADSRALLKHMSINSIPIQLHRDFENLRHQEEQRNRSANQHRVKCTSLCKGIICPA